MTNTELPVEWFDIPDDQPDQAANNDLDPTEEHWNDYAPFWDTSREWIYPHPLMEGYTCSKGWHHAEYQRSPVEPVGLAKLPVQRSQSLANHD